MIYTTKRLCCAIFVMCAIAVIGACVPVARDGGEILMFGHGYDADMPATLMLQNEHLRLYFETATAQIIVEELATGNVWRSTPDISEDDWRASAAIAQFHMQSLFILTHEDRHGRSQPYDTYRHSVRTGRFEHEVLSDTKLELRFTVGDVPQTFHIPNAIDGARLHYFTDQMPRGDMILVFNSYRGFQYSRLRPADISNGILEDFPMLVPVDGEEERVIYVLGDNISLQVQERLQAALAEVGYTIDDWYYDMAYFGNPVADVGAVFNVTMQFELVGNEMVVTVPFDNMTYNPEFLPVRLTMLPYFGAGHASDDGYLFVPDGSGAILNFDSVRHNQGVYVSNIFGWDEAVLREELIHDNRSPYPVFGIYKNGATFAAIIDEGAAYASIRAEVAGMDAPFARVRPEFRLMHGAHLDVAGRSRDAILMHEHDLQRDERIVIRYVFTENPGYVGMAIAYREFLQARYPHLNRRVEQPVNAMVEVLGAALTNQHFLGVPVERPFPLTTYEQLADMMDTFNALGWQNLHIKMRGAHNETIDHSVPSGLNLISQLGNRRDFDNMLDTASTHGFEFYLEGDFVLMRNNSMFNGFSRTRDAARDVTRQRVEHHGFGHTWFGPMPEWSVMADHVILARPEFTQDLVRNFMDEARGRGVNNIAFRTMGSALAGDFNEDAHVSREASMRMRQDLLLELMDDDTGIWLNYGFSYAVPFANVITGMPLSDQGFTIVDAAVPFYQIALHGIIPFAGRPVNLIEDFSYHLLRTVESGSSLFFSFMHVPAADLNVSRYRRYFANEFDRWIDIADEFYQRHVRDFGHLYNQLIVDHQILGDGVTVTVYEDGTRVYVNMSLADVVTSTGVAVAAHRYEVRR